MANNRRDDDLAYGDYYQGGGEGDRGIVGDMGRRLFGGSRKEVRTVVCSTAPVFCHCVPCVLQVSSLFQLPFCLFVLSICSLHPTLSFLLQVVLDMLEQAP